MTRPIDVSECVLGRSMSIDGDISFSGALRVDGTVRGDIVANGVDPSSIEVSASGVVHGEIKVARVLVSGQVTGAIHATDRVELCPDARVVGDIRYGSIEIQLGAVIVGRLIHDDGEGSNKVVTLKPTASLGDQSG